MNAADALLTVTVKPGAKAPGVVLGRDGAICLRVRERAIEGKANDAARAALAKLLDVPKSSVTLVRGAKARVKTFAVHGVTAGEIRDRCGAAG